MATFLEKFGTKYLTMGEMLDAMLDAGKTDDEILTAICKEYSPYCRFEAFGKGLVDYQANRRNDKDYDGVDGQAYDRGANAGMWLWQVQNVLRPRRNEKKAKG